MMQTADLQSELRRITSILIDKNNTAADFAATQDYIRLLNTVVDPNHLSEEASIKPVITPFGQALSTAEAARCAIDFIRTKNFVKGLALAVQAALDRFPDRPVHVLYAGTGPYATLALPLTTLYTPEQLQLTLLEIHPESYKSLQKTIHLFGIRDFIKNTLLVDATVYCPEETIHVIVSETMNYALQKEPQVAITQHLARFLAPDGIFVPELVEVTAGLLNPGHFVQNVFLDEHKKDVRPSVLLDLATLMELNATAPERFQNGFPTTVVKVTADQMKSYRILSLFTRIRVFGDIRIEDQESMLTLPFTVVMLPHSPTEDATFEFTYELSQTPGFICKAPFNTQKLSGYRFDPSQITTHLDEINKKNMIEALKSLGTETANRIIAEMEGA